MPTKTASINRRIAFSLILTTWVSGALLSSLILAVQLANDTYGSSAGAVSVLLGAQFIIPLWIFFERLSLFQSSRGSVNRSAFGWCFVCSLIYIIWLVYSLFMQGEGAPGHGRYEDPAWRNLAGLVPLTNEGAHATLWQAYVEHLSNEKLVRLCRLMPIVPAVLSRPLAKMFGILFPS
jgi:hypothetical protein